MSTPSRFQLTLETSCTKFLQQEVETVGAYPCGGTHVAGTKDVGKIIVGKIKRSKGMTKISYSVADV